MTQTKSVLAAVFFAVVLVGGSSSAAFAGEVTGKPGIPGVAGSGSGVSTGTPLNPNSICSFSGLNDMKNRPLDNITQTPAKPGASWCPGPRNLRGRNQPAAGSVTEAGDWPRRADCRGQASPGEAARED